jgi:hypothetical protein
MDWLTTPLSGASQHTLEAWTAWHARLMVLAWGALLPVGALVARYLKVTPAQRWPEQLDNRSWWHAHRALQWAGALATCAGLALAWGQARGDGDAARWHVWSAWTVLAMGAFQVVSGVLRGSKGGPTDATLRGDHYDMTAHRRWFERLHKSIGWLAVVGGAIVVGLGLWAADAPRWMPLALGLWWAALAATAVRLQRGGRCIDTYQAIWGPDPAHPGNRVRPIGWGVRRPAALPDSEPR